MGKKSIIIMTVIFTLIISFIVGYLLAGKMSANVRDVKQISQDNEGKENKRNEALSTASKDKIVILPTAKIKIKRTYKKCGHTVSEELSVPEDIVNMSENEVKKYYFGWNIEEFSDRNICISKENRGLCEEHYVVRDEDGLITVYRKDDDNNEVLVQSTEVNTKYLPSEDRKKLENGINIVGKDNLMALIEDYD